MRRVLRFLLEPFARILRLFFDPRFEQTATRIEERLDGLSLAHAKVAEQATAIGEAVEETLVYLNQTMKDVLDRTIRDLLVAVSDVGQRQSELVGRFDALKAQLIQVPESLDDLGPRDAHLLNYAESHRGYAAKRGLWLNPPVSVAYHAGSVELGHVNERIVEIPFVFEQIAPLRSMARILDVGSGESTVAFSLASLGYQVTAIDLHPYPFSHPNLTIVAQPLEEWEGPPEPFDGVVCLSSIEHFGLGVYGEEEKEGLDSLAMKMITEWAAPGAILALTVPFGRYRVDSQQRVYDREALFRILGGWEVRELRTAVRLHGAAGWQVIENDEEIEDVAEGQHPAVALISAVRTAE